MIILLFMCIGELSAHGRDFILLLNICGLYEPQNVFSVV